MPAVAGWMATISIPSRSIPDPACRLRDVALSDRRW
jgi:hypothetical protein